MQIELRAFVDLKTSKESQLYFDICMCRKHDKRNYSYLCGGVRVCVSVCQKFCGIVVPRMFYMYVVLLHSIDDYNRNMAVAGMSQEFPQASNEDALSLSKHLNEFTCFSGLKKKLNLNWRLFFLLSLNGGVSMYLLFFFYYCVRSFYSSSLNCLHNVHATH